MKQGILIIHDNSCNTNVLIEKIQSNEFPQLSLDTSQQIRIFSPKVLEAFIQEEEIHERNVFGTSNQPIKTLSGGEQKKALLNYLIAAQPAVLILDNPFDHLDIQAQKELLNRLETIATTIQLILILSRTTDIPKFIKQKYTATNNTLVAYTNNNTANTIVKEIAIPTPIEPQEYGYNYLIQCKNINVTYQDKPILNNISWNIKPGEFWQLTGPNGSGKTTLLSMITGDNVKGYGQELYIFGKKKGTGESVWDVKKSIGYFTTNLTQQFKGRYTAEQMIIGGFFDAIGLYNKPTDVQKQKAAQWLNVLGMENQKNTLFRNLPLGAQRMIMIARAMVKHPLLLILDEPTTGLDDHNANLLVTFINKIAAESNTTILYVSHRAEKGLTPDHTFTLTKT